MLFLLRYIPLVIYTTMADFIKKEPTVRVYRPDGRLLFVIFHVVIPLIRQSYNGFIIDYFFSDCNSL